MLEMWDSYNDKREKTGKVLLRCVPVPKGLYHLTVSAWIVNSQGQYLLSQRHSQKTYPLCWECTGGSVLAGEDSLNGAMREVREELGIMLNPFKAEMIYHTRREDVQWVNREVLFDMLHSGKLHPLIDYIEEIF